jgi:hypothetical protein
MYMPAIDINPEKVAESEFAMTIGETAKKIKKKRFF